MAAPAPGSPVHRPEDRPGSLGTQRWARLLPIAFITYSLAYLDRSNFSVGIAGGMKHDLHLDSGTSALIGASFFLGYFLFQVPGAMYAERRSVKRLIFWSLLAWGVLASVQGLLSSATASRSGSFSQAASSGRSSTFARK